jgi:hypothetical protein
MNSQRPLHRGLSKPRIKPWLLIKVVLVIHPLPNGFKIHTARKRERDDFFQFSLHNALLSRQEGAVQGMVLFFLPMSKHF